MASRRDSRSRDEGHLFRYRAERRVGCTSCEHAARRATSDPGRYTKRQTRPAPWHPTKSFAGAAGERRVHREGAHAGPTNHEHSRQADGTRYPGVREQVQGHLVGPVLAALRAWDPVLGLVVGSYQGCSD